jgi:hypothetical protein
MNRIRRSLLLATAGLLAPAYGQGAPLLRQRIPSSGEPIPLVGLGTARRYERPGPGLRETLARFAALGASVVDTAPVYGDAEAVVGGLLAELAPGGHLRRARHGAARIRRGQPRGGTRAPARRGAAPAHGKLH